MEITREDFTKGEERMKQALLVIDVQNEYFTGALPVTYPAGSLENITTAMDHAHRACVPVVVIQHTNPAPDAPAFRKGTHEWELHDEVKRLPADIVIEKNLPGSFTGTGLGEWLEKNGISTLTIAGYMTQMCCDTTARQAFHRGYAVNFLSDATGTLSVTNAAGSVSAADLHNAILVTQQMRFSRVMRMEEWIKGLG
jgi:nicotinamidase-related amidase